MSLSVVIRERNFSTPLAKSTGSIKVDSLSRSAIGGPKEARLTMTGSDMQIWEAIEMLRCPVEIYDEHETAVWWGYVSSVDVRPSGNAAGIGVSLDSMYNRVACAYVSMAGGKTTGTRATTTWVQDNDSVGEYGTKELRLSLANGTLEQAESVRAKALAQRKYPIPNWSFASMGAAEGSAQLTCRGWWDTLDWEMYAQNAGTEGYTTEGSTWVPVGRDSNFQKVAQGFTVPKQWHVLELKVMAGRHASAAADLVTEIWSGASTPTTLLATGTTYRDNFYQAGAWVDCDLSTTVTLDPSTQYWLVVYKTGAVDSDQYYYVNTNTACGYANGLFRIYNGSGWVANSPETDMNFQIFGTRETTAQISDLILAAGQFMTGSEIKDASGVWSSEYRDGDTTALSEIEDLLKSGVSATRRLIASVDISRFVTVQVEPTSGGFGDYLLQPDGTLTTQLGIPIAPEATPAGVWAKAVGVIPSTADISKLANPEMVFIENVEWSAGQKQPVITGRDVPTPQDLIKVSQ